METPKNTLLAHARAYAQRSAGKTTLAIAPLAVAGLTATSPDAFGVAVGPTFNPGTVTYGTGSAGNFVHNAGTAISGAAQTRGTNGVTGVTYTGSASFLDSGSGTINTTGATIQEFIISGTGNNAALSVGSDLASVHYNFTLGSTNSTNGNSDNVTITGWKLDLTVTSSTGPSSTTVTMPGVGAGNYQGTTFFPINGADAGSTLTSYSGALTVDYSLNLDSSGNGATLSVTVPVGSIDFTAVPEPSSWLIVAVGVVGAGIQLARVRQRRAGQDAPVI